MNTLEIDCRDDSAQRNIRGATLDEVVLTHFDPFNPRHVSVVQSAQYAVATSKGRVITHSASFTWSDKHD